VGHRKSYTVVIPARNEEGGLRPAVEGILKHVGQKAEFLDVIVVDDASTDKTAAIADALASEDPRVRVIHNPLRLGFGGSLKAGIVEARGEYLFLFPGDNEERADEMARILDALDYADLVVVWMTNREVRTWARRMLSAMFRIFVNVLLGIRLQKVTGPNLWRTSLLRRHPMRSNGFAAQTEALVRAVRSGVPYVQASILTKGRDYGKTKAISWHTFTDMTRAISRLWWDVNVSERRSHCAPAREIATGTTS
jgi:glycosyltransferase involved in cell wall biosynthesis